jgi:hypothetical protein
MSPTLTRTPVALAGLVLLVGSTLVGCASGPGLPPAEWHTKLRSAMQTEVSTVAQSQEQSRFLQQALDDGALEGMDRTEVQEAIGKGIACRTELCEKNGFVGSDWYYELGVIQGDAVKQLPVLIVGFDQFDRATRIWNLTTH